MHLPRYQELPKEIMGYSDLPNNGGRVRVIAGNYNDVHGPAKTFSPVTLFDIRFNLGGVADFKLGEGHNSAVLVLQGRVNVNGTEAGEGSFILLANEPGNIRIAGLTDQALVIILSGEPINEPVFQHGPFVMNTREEIIQAFQDFQTGKMGPTNF
jgi:redox-sensitive bicupin YhaK (pirin superfamily)